MKKRILIVITMLVLIAACTLGIVKRQTYTDITREKNYMDKLQVAEIPGDLAVEVCEDMNKDIIVVCDGVRPLVDKETIDDNIKVAKKTGAAVKGVPCK